MLAKQSQYLKKAYETLEEISADQQKRLEYTARQKALYDYNTLMEENYERGIEEGVAKGIEKGIEQGKQQGKEETRAEYIQRMKANGLSDELIEKIIAD